MNRKRFIECYVLRRGAQIPFLPGHTQCDATSRPTADLQRLCRLHCRRCRYATVASTLPWPWHNRFNDEPKDPLSSASAKSYLLRHFLTSVCMRDRVYYTFTGRVRFYPDLQLRDNIRIFLGGTSWREGLPLASRLLPIRILRQDATVAVAAQELAAQHHAAISIARDGRRHVRPRLGGGAQRALLASAVHG